MQFTKNEAKIQNLWGVIKKHEAGIEAARTQIFDLLGNTSQGSTTTLTKRGGGRKKANARNARKAAPVIEAEGDAIEATEGEDIVEAGTVGDEAAPTQERLVAFIKQAGKPVSRAEISQHFKLDGSKLSGLLNRTKKNFKLKSPERGIYKI